VTVLERLSLADTVAVRRASATSVEGFPQDTLVRAALDALSAVAPAEPRFEARIVKRIPVAAGLGGGSSDAGTALTLANGLLETPIASAALERLAGTLGADVPFALRGGPQLGTGDGTTLQQLDLPRDYFVLLALPSGVSKGSTGDVYAAFDGRAGSLGFEKRRAALLEELADVKSAAALAGLPPNDLAESPLSEELLALGAFRADVTGAGPAVFGLFTDPRDAKRAAAAVAGRAAVWVTTPA
jgi:4-diphosphocytidyl-2-C-methyl-D-erythritol kinase